VAVAATLEAAFAFCLGCKVYGVLIRLGVVPDTSCAACADLSLRSRGRDREPAAPSVERVG
jgi:hypothetical protein